MQIEVPLHVAEVSCVRLYGSATKLMVRLYCRQCSNCPLAGCSSACLETAVGTAVSPGQAGL